MVLFVLFLPLRMLVLVNWHVLFIHKANQLFIIVILKVIVPKQLFHQGVHFSNPSPIFSGPNWFSYFVYMLEKFVIRFSDIYLVNHNILLLAESIDGDKAVSLNNDAGTSAQLESLSLEIQLHASL